MKQIKVKKGEIIQQSGDLNSKIYFVKEGLLRSYAISEKGKEHIFMFAPEGWTVADSQPPETPCDLFIDALEDSIVIVHEKKSDQEGFNSRPLMRRLAVLQKRIIMLMSATALERYHHFVATYPEITQRVPQRMIASYLGITPEALSKVKNNRAQKK
ncbi:MAG: CRP-like cAMP-binding protein [Neolewinella sp.]|jgi:CRP-like cAMP-binding protein